jgi:hypothetical protein
MTKDAAQRSIRTFYEAVNMDLSNKLHKALPGKFHHLLGCL